MSDLQEENKTAPIPDAKNNNNNNNNNSKQEGNRIHNHNSEETHAMTSKKAKQDKTEIVGGGGDKLTKRNTNSIKSNLSPNTEDGIIPNRSISVNNKITDCDGVHDEYDDDDDDDDDNVRNTPTESNKSSESKSTLTTTMKGSPGNNWVGELDHNSSPIHSTNTSNTTTTTTTTTNPITTTTSSSSNNTNIDSNSSSIEEPPLLSPLSSRVSSSSLSSSPSSSTPQSSRDFGLHSSTPDYDNDRNNEVKNHQAKITVAVEVETTVNEKKKKKKERGDEGEEFLVVGEEEKKAVRRDGKREVVSNNVNSTTTTESNLYKSLLCDCDSDFGRPSERNPRNLDSIILNTTRGNDSSNNNRGCFSCTSPNPGITPVTSESEPESTPTKSTATGYNNRYDELLRRQQLQPQPQLLHSQAELALVTDRCEGIRVSRDSDSDSVVSGCASSSSGSVSKTCSWCAAGGAGGGVVCNHNNNNHYHNSNNSNTISDCVCETTSSNSNSQPEVGLSKLCVAHNNHFIPITNSLSTSSSSSSLLVGDNDNVQRLIENSNDDNNDDDGTLSLKQQQKEQRCSWDSNFNSHSRQIKHSDFTTTTPIYCCHCGVDFDACCVKDEIRLRTRGVDACQGNNNNTNNISKHYNCLLEEGVGEKRNEQRQQQHQIEQTTSRSSSKSCGDHHHHHHHHGHHHRSCSPCCQELSDCSCYCSGGGGGVVSCHHNNHINNISNGGGENVPLLHRESCGDKINESINIIPKAVGNGFNGCLIHKNCNSNSIENEEEEEEEEEEDDEENSNKSETVPLLKNNTKNDGRRTAVKTTPEAMPIAEDIKDNSSYESYNSSNSGNSNFVDINHLKFNNENGRGIGTGTDQNFDVGKVDETNNLTTRMPSGSKNGNGLGLNLGVNLTHSNKVGNHHSNGNYNANHNEVIHSDIEKNDISVISDRYNVDGVDAGGGGKYKKRTSLDRNSHNKRNSMDTMKVGNNKDDDDDGDDDDVDGTKQCGCGSLRLDGCESFRRPGWFVLIITLFSSCQGMAVNGYVNTVISTLERRFGINSTESGLIASCYDIMFVVLVIPVAYFGGRGNKIRYLSLGSFVMGIGSFLFSLPHFISDEYQVSNAEETVCLRNVTSADYCDLNKHPDLSYYKYYFFFGQLLHGAGATALYTLAAVYVDENVSQRSSSAYNAVFYTGSVIGPALGYMVGGQFLKMYTDMNVDPDSLGLTTNNPRWVGAWWIGFLITGTFACLLSIPLLAFPPSLPGAHKFAEERGKEAHATQTVDETGRHKSVRDVLLSIKILLFNVPYMFINLAAAGDALLVSGFSTFLPKYIEYQFGLTASTSALYVGLAAVPAGGGATFLGGYLVTKFDLKMRGILRFCAICSGALVLLLFAFMLKCDGGAFAGVTVPYGQISGGKPLTNKMFDSSCNSGCQCAEENYYPMCGRDGVMYFSPCYAGCSAVSDDGDTKFYSNCSCVNYNLTSDDLASGSTHMGKFGKCEESCGRLPLFIVITSVMMVLIFLTSMPSLTATLRCVPDHQRSFGLGIQWIIARCLGSIPGPILFGKMFDEACSLWQTKCEGSGSCYFYNNEDTRTYLAIIAVIFSFLTALCFVLAFWFYVPKPVDPAVNLEIQIERSTSQNTMMTDTAPPTPNVDTPHPLTHLPPSSSQ